MLTGLNQTISQILSLFQWWIVIAPWEMAIRVRRGNRIAVLNPGIHFRIPVFDRFFVQRTKKRYINTPTQAVTTSDGKAITVSGGTAYTIIDIALLYNTLSDPQDVVEIETLSLIAKHIAEHKSDEISPVTIQNYVNQNLNLKQYGLGDTSFLVTDFVCVKTYRLINSNPKDYTYSNQALSTAIETKLGQASS